MVHCNFNASVYTLCVLLPLLLITGKPEKQLCKITALGPRVWLNGGGTAWHVRGCGLKLPLEEKNQLRSYISDDIKHIPY